MDLHKAQWNAKKLMQEHGLVGWTFNWTKSTSLLGRCSFNIKQIQLSLSNTHAGSEEQVTNTVLHEIAHALVGPGHHHDDVWRSKALSIGCSGNRCTEVAPGNEPQKRYVGTCSTHGEVSQREKMTHRKYSCPKCSPAFDIRYLVQFKYNPQYVAFKQSLNANRPR